MRVPSLHASGTEVFIVGAGPTGLALGLWLTHQGIRVRIIDKAAGPGTTSRAMAVQARTLEFYGQVGLADAAIAGGMKNPAMNLWAGGERRARISMGAAGAGITPYPFLLIYPQDRHERLLAAALAAQGVEVEWRTELLDFVEGDGRVTVRTKAADGSESEGETQYLAGCDGARSTVRHKLGAGFEGGTYAQVFYVADVTASGPQPFGEAHICLESSDFVALMSYDHSGHARLIGTVRDDRAGGETLAFEDVSQDAIRSLGVEIQAVNWFSTYRVHHRVTDRYRQGRVFLLGDAAHVHSPAGGQGMNTGIGDAVNLAWKLKSVIREGAADSLLETYEFERKAFAEKLVATTDRLFTSMTSDSRFATLMRRHVAPLLAPAAYRIGAVREELFGLVSQTRIHYRSSPLSEGSAGGIESGDRLPWLQLGNSDNFEPLKSIDWQVHVHGAVQPVVAGWCARRGLPLHLFDWREESAKAGFARDALYLVRPDMHVALADASGAVERLESYWGLRPPVRALVKEAARR